MSRFRSRKFQGSTRDKKRAQPLPQRQASKPKAYEGHFIMGRNSVGELLRFQPERIRRIFLSKKLHEDLQTSSQVGAKADDLITEIYVSAQKHNIPIEALPQADLSAQLRSDSHQGCAALVQEKLAQDLRTVLEYLEPAARAIVLCLDGVQDPQNLGTILRAAECFGVDVVLWSKNRCPGITPVVAKASVGATELVEYIEVSNLVDAIRKFREQGFWVVEASADPDAQDVSSFQFPEKSVLVLGAEGKGTSRLASAQADFRVRIPLFGRIDSLNVSQATAILLHRARAATALSP